MWKISIGSGALLVALGVGFHVGTDSDSLTSLIAALFGGVIILSGVLSMKESFRPHAAHVAALVGVFGVLGGLGMAVPVVLQESAGAAQTEQLIMGVICAVYVYLCVRSFIEARKTRAAQEDSAAR